MSDLIDAKETASLLNVSRPTVARLAAGGEIPSLVLARGGRRGRRLFSRAAVLAYIARGLAGGNKERKASRLPDAKSAALAQEVNELEATCQTLSQALTQALTAGRLLSEKLPKKTRGDSTILEAIATLENLALSFPGE